MARLAAVSVACHFPTPERVIDLIAGTVRFGEVPDNPVPVRRVLDTCAGEGTAVARLAGQWCAESYGVELDAGRAALASDKMTACLAGSYHQLAAPEKSFNILFLNPPYDSGIELDGASLRQEVQFLRDATPWLVPGGLLVFVPPRHLLKNEKLREHLRRNYRDVQAWAFPEPEREAFDQVVLIARRSFDTWGYSYVEFKPDELPVLGESMYLNGQNVFLPKPSSTDPFTFELRGEDPVKTAPRWSLDGSTGAYASKQWDLLCGARGGAARAPLTAPRPGHQAMLLAAGALDGAELDGGVLIKGSSEKIIIESADEEEGTVTERERIVSRLSVLDLTSGEVESWRVDQAPEKTAEWFERHGEALARVILRSHTPSFNGDVSRYQGTFAKLTAPGILPGRSKPEFLEQQLEAAAAVAHHWVMNKTVFLAGEQGTGKTTMAVLASEAARHKKTVVVCPSHLVPKWCREVDRITRTKGAAIAAKSLADVDRFFASPTARYLILSKERAKLGSRWEPRYSTRNVVRSREIVDQEKIDANPGMYGWGSGDYYRPYGYTPQPKKTIRETVAVVSCPRCGTIQKTGEMYLVPKQMDDKLRRNCSDKKCREPLWQAVPLNSKGTLRHPIAKYINQHYAHRYSLVADEMHGFAKADSDQSRAVQLLISGAVRTLGMTGTIYGGRASSIFHLLFKFDPSFRESYKYVDCDRFVSHHGLFETRFEERERTSYYGYRKGRTGGRIKEIPGMNPAMIPLLLPFTIFVKLRDLRVELPPYSEEVVLVDHLPEVQRAASRLQSDVKSILREHPQALGSYLMACLGYPDRPDQGEEITVTDNDGVEHVLATAHPVPIPPEGLPKDRKVVELALAEREQGRKVLVYFSQTHKRDARGRVRAALEAAGLKVAVLDSNVAPDKREEWLQKAVTTGFDVMLTNGRLVETGMDLLFAATIVQYGTEYSIPSLRQSIRRSWRLGQDKPVRVVFLAYRGTMQSTALDLIAKKMRAAEMVDGDETGGLAAYDDSGKDFFVELAMAAVADAASAPPAQMGLFDLLDGRAA